jgi:hypothetical protein
VQSDRTKLQPLVLLTGGDSILMEAWNWRMPRCVPRGMSASLVDWPEATPWEPEFVAHSCGIAPDFLHHRVFGRADDGVEHHRCVDDLPSRVWWSVKSILDTMNAW